MRPGPNPSRRRLHSGSARGVLAEHRLRAVCEHAHNFIVVRVANLANLLELLFLRAELVDERRHHVRPHLREKPSIRGILAGEAGDTADMQLLQNSQR